MNPNKIIIVLLTTVVSTNLTFSQGLKFTPKETMESFPVVDNNSYGFSGNLPYKYSLEKHVPAVLEQNGQSCVGFASLYYTMSTMYNLSFNITDHNAKIAHAFDPYFIYTILQKDVSHCENGLYMYEAIDLITKVGAKKMFFPPFLNCSSDMSDNVLTNTLKYSKPYRAKDFYTADINHPEIISTIKGSIYNGLPVACGFSITKSLYPSSSSNPMGVGSDGLWIPSDLGGIEGGHAMTVVGYDNYKYGGAFRIVNSWGSNYGDNGFIWMKYSDFRKYVNEAYVIELNDNINSNSRTSKVQMQGDNYSRFKYGISSFYEGQEKYNDPDGYGIYTADYDETFLIGKTINSSINGFVIIIDDDGIYTSNAINGKFYEINKLGFAGSQESLETEYQFNKYFSVLNSSKKIRKASSTKLEKKRFEVSN